MLNISCKASQDGCTQTDTRDTTRLPGNIRVVGCWAHARRKFDEALQTLPKEMQKDSPAAIGECYCSRLFKLEQAFAELTPEERYEKRLEQAETCFRRVVVMGK